MAYFVPSAQITLVAEAQPFSANADVSAQPGSGPIHVRFVTVDKRASTSRASTGTKVASGELASGTFTYVNACPQALTIPNGQRLQGPGVMFAQLGEVKVDPGSSAKGSIKAVQPGQNGNVQAGQITALVPNPYPCLTGTNQEPTTGGADGQKSTVIQSSDLQGARAVLEQQLRQQILDELNRGAQKGEKLVGQPIFATEDFNPDHQVDDQVPGFTATLHLVAEGDYYSADDVTRAFAAVLKSKVAAGQQLTTDSVTTNYSVSATSGGHLDFAGQVSGFVAARLDTERLRGQLVGKSAGAAHDLLTGLPVRQVEIKQSPFPLPLMPLSSSRIHIEYLSPGPAPGSG
jgi:hypothetical protein